MKILGWICIAVLLVVVPSSIVVLSKTPAPTENPNRKLELIVLKLDTKLHNYAVELERVATEVDALKVSLTQESKHRHELEALLHKESIRLNVNEVADRLQDHQIDELIELDERRAIRKKEMIDHLAERVKALEDRIPKVTKPNPNPNPLVPPIKAKTRSQKVKELMEPFPSTR